jgi:hypothetical protein
MSERWQDISLVLIAINAYVSNTLIMEAILYEPRTCILLSLGYEGVMYTCL